MNFKKFWKEVIVRSFSKFMGDNSFRHSSSIAFYTIFSIPGIILLSISLAGSFYKDDVVKDQLITQAQLMMGPNSAQVIDSMMQEAALSGDSFILKVVGIITLLISATTVFVSLQDSLNTVWRIRPKPRREILKFITNRLMSLAMVASLGFLILVTLMADTLIAILKHGISFLTDGLTYYVIYFINLSLSLGLIILIFALIFKILPDARIRWKDVWVGAIITALLFSGGKLLIGFYLSKQSFDTNYGGAGSLVALLSWVYYSVLILIYGAQFTFVYAAYKGRNIRPDKHAVALIIEEVERENAPVTKIKDPEHKD